MNEQLLNQQSLLYAQVRNSNSCRFFLFVLLVFSFIGCSKRQDESNYRSFQNEILTLEESKTLADSLYRVDNYRAAIQFFSKVLKDDSLNGEYFYKRGFSYGQLGVYDSSSQDFQKAVRFGHRAAEAYYNLGLNEIPSLNDSLAVFYFEKSLELNPNSPETVAVMESCKKRLQSKGAKTTSI